MVFIIDVRVGDVWWILHYKVDVWIKIANKFLVPKPSLRRAVGVQPGQQRRRVVIQGLRDLNGL